MDKQLRLTAAAIVTESKLSRGAKLQLLKFIQKEATDIQIKALLLDGEILPKIDKQTKEIIESRFKVCESNGRFSKQIMKCRIVLQELKKGSKKKLSKRNK